ncbi:MAG: M13 family metallopeptidase [Sphingosinicella sp.]|uniref:M13 family metallopeptidase n=1 Tax=Sphingosinicella sp. TaxID=1917971 RepID=UPI004037A716
MLKSRLALVSALLLAGAAPILAQPAATPAGKAHYGSFGIDLAARDTNVKAGDDFFRYANATWLQNNPIPADRTNWSLWTVLGEDIEAQLRAIAENPGDDPAARQIRDFYASWMDEAGIERRGLAPARPYLDRIAAVNDRAALLRLFMTPGYASPVGVGIFPDPADTTRYVAGAGQSGLGMPNRDYYLREGAQYDRYRTAYRAYVVSLFRLAGVADPESRADGVIALERRMAEAHWAPERRRDIRQIYNPMNREQLNALAPQFDWPTMLQHRGLGNVPTVVAAETTAITALGQMLDTVPIDTWKDWLTFQFLSANAQYLPRAFDEANFNFYSRTLRGVPEQRDRWKRGLDLLNGAMGESVGRIYVARHFPAESRRQMSELIGNLRAAFRERLERLDWMDDATRAQALAKLDTFEPRIGHPERFIDYSAIRVDPGDVLGNVQRAGDFRWNLQLSRLPNPVDRGLWGMNPQIINASYNPLMNQITFPAGILQPPFFDPNADPAVNYGAIGAVIGHEIGHGFDDLGRRFDPQGRIRDWWTPETDRRFTERTTRLGAQYGAYEPLPGLNVNGQLTMGENIGDLGGLEMAYAAYRRHVAQHGEPPVFDGLTGDQRFFLAWAQVWRGQHREDALRERVLTDPHSPYEYRVNGVVRNIDAWYRAFNVQPGDRLHLPPEQRVRIW